MNLDHYYMRKALQEARIAQEYEEVPIGAIIVSGDKILAKAHNQTEKLNDPTAHAEMIAITSACHTIGSRYLKECTIFVTLEPCPMCASALKWAQIGTICFGAYDKKNGFLSIDQQIIHPYTQLVSGVMKEQCAELLSSFFSARRK